MMGGEIRVESEPGKGSTFGFTARFGVRQIHESDRESDGAKIDLRGLPILIVDDNLTGLRILEDMLHDWGAQPVGARDAAAALSAIARHRDTGARFPLILIDAEMPDVSGFALAERIRKEADPTARIIMLLSSAGELADGARCRALVEDNPINRRVAMRLLEKRGHTVVTANNGREALEVLERLHWTVGLILMDVQMPEMGGYRATAAIRHREKSTGSQSRSRHGCIFVEADPDRQTVRIGRPYGVRTAIRVACFREERRSRGALDRGTRGPRHPPR